MPNHIQRQWTKRTCTIANGGTTGDIDLRNFAGGVIQLPAAITGTALAWHISIDGTTYTALYDDASTPAAKSMTVAASRAYPIPAEAFGAGYARIVMDAQGAARTILVGLQG